MVIRLFIGMLSMSLFFTAFLSAGGAEVETKTVKGDVELVCPQGRYLELKTTDGKTLSFNVLKQAFDQVKILKKGDFVKAEYMVCPKSKKYYISGVKKVKK